MNKPGFLSKTEIKAAEIGDTIPFQEKWVMSPISRSPFPCYNRPMLDRLSGFLQWLLFVAVFSVLLASSTPPLITYRKHQGVTLTPQGERAALEVIRHHRLIETYLVQALGYSWDEVHEEACRLEHVISENLEARIARALGDPSHDPHGDPIPSADLTMPDEHLRALSSLRPSQRALIERVNNEEPAFLRHLQELGLILGAAISVRDYSEFDGNLTLDVGPRTIVVGPAISQQIFVSNES